MSGDLISREALVNSLLQVWQEYEKGNSKYCATMRGGIRKGLREVEKAPAVDAEPVRRSRWHYLGDGYFFCSGCKKYIVCVCGDADLNYCPNCGAKMDKESENETAESEK